MMHAGAVVILAVLQKAFIWAVITSNRFAGNYFTPLLRELQWNITDGSQVNILVGSVIALGFAGLCFAGRPSRLCIGYNLNLSSNTQRLWRGIKVLPLTNCLLWLIFFKSYMQLAFLKTLDCCCGLMVQKKKKISTYIHAIKIHHILLVLKVCHITDDRSDFCLSKHSAFVHHMLPIMGEKCMWKMCVIWRKQPSVNSTALLMRQLKVFYPSILISNVHLVYSG